MEKDLFDIEYWLPFNGGEYHCTIAVGVTQEYVDRVKTQYEIDLNNWRTTPSAWRLPFFHSLNIVKHNFMANNSSFQKSDEYNKKVEEARREGIKEGTKITLTNARYYITNKANLKEFDKNFNL